MIIFSEPNINIQVMIIGLFMENNTLFETETGMIIEYL